MASKIVLFFLFITFCTAFEDKSIVQYIQDNGYTRLVEALNAAGLTSTLDGSGPFTLYAPTDAAFLGFNTHNYTKEQLAKIFKYHVVAEFVLVPMITTTTNKTTLESQQIVLAPSPLGITINGKATIDPADYDIIVNNGVVQPIDMLLSSPTFIQHNIYQVLLRDPLFADLTLALLLADLVTTLEVSEYTLFAPTNAAFAKYQDSLFDPNIPNVQNVYREVLKNHIVPGARRSSDLRNGLIYTLHGTPLNVTIGSGVRVNTANVVKADILASNGVIYGIDDLLIPQDFNQIAGRK